MVNMKKPLEEEETLLEDGTIETSDVELKDTFFFADVNDHFFTLRWRYVSLFYRPIFSSILRLS
jgi:hypothetical protein